MRCPICQKPVSIDDPEMPFCSERCRLLDLGNWASEKYVISTPASEVPEEEEPRRRTPKTDDEDESPGWVN